MKSLTVVLTYPDSIDAKVYSMLADIGNHGAEIRIKSDTKLPETIPNFGAVDTGEKLQGFEIEEMI